MASVHQYADSCSGLAYHRRTGGDIDCVGEKMSETLAVNTEKDKGFDILS